MGGYLALLRPANGLVAGLAVLAGGVASAGPPALGPPLATPLLIAALSAFLFTGGGNSLNDYLDRAIDKHAHPERPIPSGRVKPRAALGASALLFSAALGCALWISLSNPQGVDLMPTFVVALSALVMVGYELKLKALGLRGNIAIGLLSGITFWYGGIVVGSGDRAIPLALLAIVATIGREIAKDIEDMDADMGRRTLPQRAGKDRAAKASITSTAAAVALSPFPFFPLSILGLAYVPAVAAADATFIYAAYLVRASPARSQRMSKAGMALATLAFGVGGWFR